MRKKKRKNPIVIIVILLGILLILSVPQTYANFLDKSSSKNKISLDTALNENPSIATYYQNIHIVWDSFPSELNSEILYRKSNDNGKTWDEPIKITLNTSKAVEPDIAVYKNTVHIVWKDYRNNNPEIYYIKSIDSGNSWSKQQRITYNNPRKNNIYDINIECDKTNVYLVWKDYRTNSSEIFFKKSNDTGDTWSDDQRLTIDFNPSYYPFLSIFENNIYVVYEDRGFFYNLCLLKSTDYGETWSDKYLLTDTEDSSEKPNIFISENKIYLIWLEYTSNKPEIYFKKSIDNGKTWEEKITIASSSDFIIKPSIYANNNKIIITWHEQKDDTFYIKCRESNNAGKSWDEIRELVDDMDCYNSKITGEGDNIYLCWQERHQAAWSDIWFMGDYNYSNMKSVIDDEVSQKQTPGFTFYMFLFLMIIITCLHQKLKKKR